MTVIMDPDCAAGKHTNCDGTGWDEKTEALADCPCACHRSFACSVTGCDADAVTALRFRDQPGHVHVCRADEAINREWAEVVESAPMPCPWLCSPEVFMTAVPTLIEDQTIEGVS